MPSHRQLVVEVPPSERALGSSETSAAQASYPASPIHNGELDDNVVRTFFQEQVIIGVVNDGGHTFGEFDRDYSGAVDGVEGSPNLLEVTTDNEGNPLSSPYAPSVASPPGGADDWANQPATPEQTESAGRNSLAPFVGDGLASPRDTAANISQQTIGSLRKGTSTPGSSS
jgi:hypothetical protein